MSSKGHNLVCVTLDLCDAWLSGQDLLGEHVGLDVSEQKDEDYKHGRVLHPAPLHHLKKRDSMYHSIIFKQGPIRVCLPNLIQPCHVGHMAV